MDPDYLSDLRANNIHVSTTINNDEEILALKQGHSLIATVVAGAEGMYEIDIIVISPFFRVEEDVSQIAWEGGLGVIINNLARKYDMYLTASALSDT